MNETISLRSRCVNDTGLRRFGISRRNSIHMRYSHVMANPIMTATIRSLTVASLLAAAVSTSATASAQEPPAPSLVSDVIRISGADRYEVAANIAAQMRQAAQRVVFVASGETFPDALSAGPSTLPWKAELLLVSRTSIPDKVVGEIRALNPVVIKIVGGVNSVSIDVEKSLHEIVPGASIERIGGADRYEVSRNLSSLAIPRSNYTPFLATGATFSDALSAGSAAGKGWNPLILVPGTAPGLDAPTRSALTGLGTVGVTIVGGPLSVSPGIEAEVQNLAPTTRAGGANRYAASLAVNKLVFTAAKTAYLATGENFPDALTGGVLAGTHAEPLYIVPGTCVPEGVLADFRRLGVEHVVLIGGPNSLSDDVFKLTSCGV
ncbi:cell wall-binding repeat-containing protein [Herbiconiux sp. P17]|uniref:cell wall-binding repeat-containing protein n=1 Tax=Herbiconiux wuyangfengii TaxID=3342794 RepID=UPI0035B8CA5D